MKIRKFLTAALIVLAALIGYALAQSPNSAHSSESVVHRFADASEIDGSYSQLIRIKDAVAMEISTIELEADAPYTAWWVVFNTPQGCSEACNEDDIFDADGNMSLNPEANISILFADGAMSDADGNASFSATLPEGRTLGEVLAGPGLTDAKGAEIHLVVRYHGEFDAARAYEQLSTFEPTCEACADVQFVVYQAVNQVASR